MSLLYNISNSVTEDRVQHIHMYRRMHISGLTEGWDIYLTLLFWRGK
jgi:hypothetical protein